MLVPAHALAGFEAFRELLLRSGGRERALKCARKKRWAIVVRHGERLLFAQMKFAGPRIVRDVSARSLGAEPLAHITLRGAGPFRQFAGRLWPARYQRLIQTQFVTDANQCRIEGRAEIDDRLPKKFVQLIRIDSHYCLR